MKTKMAAFVLAALCALVAGSTGLGSTKANVATTAKMPSSQERLAMMREMPAMRAAAAKKAAAKGLVPTTRTAPVKIKGKTVSPDARAATGFATAGGKNALRSLSLAAAMKAALGIPDYFGAMPNYANSPLPLIDATTGAVMPNTGIRKFVDTLPGLGAANANDLGQYIPVAVPDTTTYPGSDYYVIELGQYTEQMHADLPATTLRGYRQLNGPNGTAESFHYLGPIIVAQKDRPVRVKFVNSLPTGAAGDLFLPVDSSIMGAGMGPNGGTEMYTQNRATLHLHGGNTPWISDGTQHQWITPAAETTSYPKGVSVKNVPDMGTDCDAANSGCQTFYYTNQQSARLLFYHDHAYGITRLNVYGGEAAGYLVQDPVEQGLVADGTIPSDQIPLVIQDKTFVPDDAQLLAEDPTWDTASWGGKGNLWLPHVYMPNQNPDDPTGANPMGRWDYGPWFWPPFTGQTFGPVPNPLFDPVNAPWEGSQNPGTPNPTIVPEAFMDTPVVNGTAYPVLNVDPKAYRFRILNAANDRYWNLSLWQSASQNAMWNPDGTLADGMAGEVSMVPFNSSQNAISPFPKSWYDGGVPNPFDDRVGGVPDPTTAGPQMLQIGNEAEMLPVTAPIENRPVNYVMNKRDITVGNIAQKALFLGPAERADVVVDFSQFAGKTLILYNDSPAPVPAGDPRYDYYTGDMDQTPTGGAPTTLPGYGPNTRTVMMIKVAAATPVTFDKAKLDAALPTAYAASQRKPLVPQPGYNSALGATFPNALVRIQDTSLSFNNGLYGLTGLNLTAGGSGYTDVPAVTFTGGGGSGAAAVAKLAPTSVASVVVTNGGSGYTDVPNVGIANGVTQKATASASLVGTSVSTITVLTGGSKYTSIPTVTISGCNGTGATATAVVTNRIVTAINVVNHGSGYTCRPTVTISGGGGSGATARAILTPTSIASVTIGNAGAGYTVPPAVTFSGGGGTGATAYAVLTPTSVASVSLTAGGSGYTSLPTVGFDTAGGPGTGATATASMAVTMGLEPKSIIEDFDPEYGRMNAMLGVEIPKTTATIQTSIPYLDVDPPTEVIKSSNAATPLGILADGTQIWKITHNGVDTHAMHWHMFDVQVINRVGWDGAIRPADANELGWKDTVRMNPLEDIIVALRPIIPDVPWDLPNSVRPLDVTAPLGAPLKWAPGVNVDPTNQPVTINNQLVNFGWEYVWHCHLLGHEENIMMRPIVIGVEPRAASNLTAALVTGGVTLTWSDNSANETGFLIQRASSPLGPWTTMATAAANAVTYTDTSTARRTTYVYRVVAANVVGLTQTFAAPAVGFPHPQLEAAPTPTVTITTT